MPITAQAHGMAGLGSNQEMTMTMVHGTLRGKGQRYGSTFEAQRKQAERLRIVNGMAPAVCIFQNDARWSYGILFYPEGAAPREQIIENGPDAGVIITPVWQKGQGLLRVHPTPRRRSRRRSDARRLARANRRR